MNQQFADNQTAGADTVFAGADTIFAGSVPELYDRLLVPLIFETYAEDLVRRVGETGASTVLEVAAGSGVVTRALASGLSETTAITASDLSPTMLDQAQAVGTDRPVTWQVADVMDLPFNDAAFDVVVCQFGVMFFPDHAEAYREVARVLKPGGSFIFSVWDMIENNEFADVVTTAVAGMWPQDPPRFLPRTPHGYFDEVVIKGHLKTAGFDGPAGFEALEARSLAASAEIPAIAYCQGTPLRNEIEARDPQALSNATRLATKALQQRFGATDLDSKIRGFVVTATKPLEG